MANTKCKKLHYDVEASKVAGSVNGGVLLCYLRFLSEREADADGWFSCKQEKIQEATFLTRRELESTRAKLVEVGIVERTRRGLPPTTYYRILEKQEIL